jgi:hypothetical protein
LACVIEVRNSSVAASAATVASAANVNFLIFLIGSVFLFCFFAYGEKPG